MMCRKVNSVVAAGAVDCWMAWLKSSSLLRWNWRCCCYGGGGWLSAGHD